ncbi:auxin-induced protein AUX22-like isoform X3 [Rutidosis leptorrhynchoides]
METEGFGLEITELRLGLPSGGGGERNEKTRMFLDIVGDGSDRNNEMAVGWPPVCSYRKRTITKLYVKVSMDGAPFLRKIDINSFRGYSDFVMALENLFGLGDTSEYTPIYEDKDGDWMLVGDVPWR